ncbi:hypothetical protein D3C74_246280 [compost metagenome]
MVEQGFRISFRHLGGNFRFDFLDCRAADLRCEEVIALIRFEDQLCRRWILIHQRGRLRREIVRNHDGHVVVVVLHSGFRLLASDEFPPKIVAFLQLGYEILTGFEFFPLVLCPLVFVHHRNRQLVHLPVWIPEGRQEHAAVQNGNEQHNKNRDEHFRILEGGSHILEKYA